MMDTSKCSHTECVTMTNRQFLAYAFSSNFTYEVVFEKQIDEPPEDICDEQRFLIIIVNNGSDYYLDLYYEPNSSPSLAYAVCYIRPNFEDIEPRLKDIGLESFLNENISLIIQDEEFLVSNTYVSQEFTQKYVSISIKVENLRYDMTGLVYKNLEKFGSKYLPNTFKIKTKSRKFGGQRD